MEFDLIACIQRRARRRGDVVTGIGDDAAVLRPGDGRELVVTTDVLNEGVHFLAAQPPADIGWKALAVNLSDLAAMGAAPAWCTLALTLPGPDAAWCDAMLDGFFALADTHDIALVGGDTTRGPLALGVTAIGQIEPARVLRRAGAMPGDDIWVSGTLGDAAAALALAPVAGGDAPDAFLRERLQRPTPRVALGRALAGVARAGIDLSDGLLADLGHICKASGVGARVMLDELPASPPLVAAAGGRHERWNWQVAGGDDYELCVTAPPGARERILSAAEAAGVPVTRIGVITDPAPAGPAVRLVDSGGESWVPDRSGYQHFA
ncbi:MAG: thiamine-phosphate kinase [Gammaproteobacteria bacterium]|nr:thiamine-phosphate kinase [Gammaproteobacteria bacterium]